MHVGHARGHVLELGEAILGDLDHARVHVHARERATVGRERARRRAVSRAHVEHVTELQQRPEPGRERLPGTARRVVALELVGERARESAAPFGFQLLKAAQIALERRVARLGRFFEHHPSGLGQVVEREGIEGLGALPAVPNEPRLPQPAEVGRNPRLGDPGHLDQVRNAELALPEQRTEPNSALVAQEVQRFDRVGQAHLPVYPVIQI